MYVCVCNAIRDGALKTLAREGVRCAYKAYESLGHAPRCGACLDTAHRILEDTGGQSTHGERIEEIA